jgi:hypothetical protein
MIAGSPSWSQDVDQAAQNPLPFANLAYTLHYYAGTHRQELRDKAMPALANGLALLVTEFGVVDADGDGPIALEESERWWDWAERTGSAGWPGRSATATRAAPRSSRARPLALDRVRPDRRRQAAARKTARRGRPESGLPRVRARHTLAVTFGSKPRQSGGQGRDRMNASTRTSVNTGLISMIVAVATIGGLLFGYDSGAVNGTQDGLRTEFGLSDASLGFTVGSLLIGCAVGAFFAGRLADVIGRRMVMVLAALLFVVGALVQGLTGVHEIFVVARFAGGMAVGAASVLSPLYISEMAPANIRGRLTTVQQVMIISGLTLAFVVNYFLAQTAAARSASSAGARRGAGCT